MEYLTFLTTVFALLPVSLCAPQSHARSPAAEVNPYLEVTPYANKGYAAKLEQTIKSFLDAGDELNAARTRTVQKTPTFVWVTSSSEIRSVRSSIAEALEAQKDTGKQQLVQIVVWNMPDRDCSTETSTGEFDLADGGLDKYKSYIDAIAAELSTTDAQQLHFTVILEPDVLGSLITNLNIEKCAKAANAYKEALSYAIVKLQRKNVALYLEAAHGGWLGWPANLKPSAALFAEILKGAKAIDPSAKVRGLAINVSNYNQYIASARDPIAVNDSWDEFHYLNNLIPHLEAAGYPAHFIVDQSRSGKAGIRSWWSNRCNIRNAGFGTRPTADQAVLQNKNVDALVWVKPGGESDGTSDAASPLFSWNCQSEDSHVPAPDAGKWFNEYAVSLVMNANPPLEPLKL